jgi:hypothetical protein
MKNIKTFEQFTNLQYHPVVENNLNSKFFNWFHNSKITESNGNPIVMYHTGKNSLVDNSFLKKYITKDDRFLHGYGIYFTSDEGYSVDNFGGENGGFTYPCYLSLKNPFKVNLDEDDEVIFDERFINSIDNLKDGNFSNRKNNDILYDYFLNNKKILTNIIKNYSDSIWMFREDGPDEIIVFSPNNRFKYDSFILQFRVW